MDLRLTINKEQLVRALRDAPAETAYQVRDGLFHIKAKFFKAWWFAARAKMNIRPKIGLINRVIGQVFANVGNLRRAEIRIVNYSRAFWKHELGGEIGAKGKLMTVPITQYRADKWGQVQGRQLTSRRRGKLLASGKLQGYPTRKGTFLGKPRRGGQPPQFFFKLQRSVKLRPRLSFYSTWRGLQPFAISRLDKALQRAVAKFNRAGRAA